MKIIKLEETGSTNNWLNDHDGEITSPTFVYTNVQSAGRGQRGNSWESEPGKNITGSLLFHPESFHAALQFHISEAVALALVDLLKRHGISAKVKWPNDICVGNKKICGILMEHIVTGHDISRTIAGIGLNVNQEVFISDAPNPISMKMITGQEYDVDKLALELSELLETNLERLSEPRLIHTQFMENLWRNDGHFYPFFDRRKNELIYARIHSVATDGILTLMTENGEQKGYAFKEIEFRIEKPDQERHTTEIV